MSIELGPCQWDKKLPSPDLAGIGANPHSPGKRPSSQKLPSGNFGDLAGGKVSDPSSPDRN